MSRFDFKAFFNQASLSQGFRGPVLTLLSGNGLVSALSYFAMLVLVRLFDETEFGVFEVYLAIVTLIALVSSGRYEDALMLPKSTSDARHILVLAGGLVLGTALLTGIAGFWSETVATMLGTPALAPWIIWIPAGVLFLGWIRVGEVWLTRHQQFRAVAGTRVFQSSGKAVSQLGFGASGFGIGGLLYGYLIGQALGFFNIVYAVGKETCKELLHINRRRLMMLAKQYQNFVRFSTPAALLNHFAFLPLVLSFLFDESVVGFFGRGHKLFAVPLALVGQAMAQVFFVRAAEAHWAGDVRPLTRHVYRRLVMIGLFPMCAIMIAGPELFRFVLGDNWEVAGLYARHLAPWIFLAYVASPLTRLFDVLEKQRADLTISTIMFITHMSVLILVGFYTDPLTTIVVFGHTGALLRLIHIGWMFRMSGVRLGAMAEAFLRYGPFALMGICILILSLLTQSDALILLGAIIATVVYYGFILRSEEDIDFFINQEHHQKERENPTEGKNGSM